jgi:hypothetical protein
MGRRLCKGNVHAVFGHEGSSYPSLCPTKHALRHSHPALLLKLRPLRGAGPVGERGEAAGRSRAATPRPRRYRARFSAMTRRVLARVAGWVPAAAAGRWPGSGRAGGREEQATCIDIPLVTSRGCSVHRWNHRSDAPLGPARPGASSGPRCGLDADWFRNRSMVHETTGQGTGCQPGRGLPIDCQGPAGR